MPAHGRRNGHRAGGGVVHPPRVRREPDGRTTLGHSSSIERELIMTSHQGVGASQATGWVGWIAFGAVMMMMLGVLNAISGLAAIFNDQLFVAGKRGLLIFDVTAWGWIHLILGLVVVLTGFALMSGAMWARVVGTGLVMLNMVTQLIFLPAYPFWGMLIIALDVLVLWAIIVHGAEAKDAGRRA